MKTSICRHINKPAERTIQVFGWGSIPGCESSKNEVYLFLDDEAHRVYYKLASGQERPDVAAALGDPRQLHAGFSVRTVLPDDFTMTENVEIGFCVVNREEKQVAELTRGTVKMVFENADERIQTASQPGVF